jgi:hypothetical protein
MDVRRIGESFLAVLDTGFGKINNVKVLALMT